MNGVVHKIGAGPEQIALEEAVELEEGVGDLSGVIFYPGEGLPQVLNNPGSSPDQGHGQPGGLFQIEGHLRNFSTGHGFKPLLTGNQGVPEKAIKGGTDRQGKTTSGAPSVRKKLMIEQLISRVIRWGGFFQNTVFILIKYGIPLIPREIPSGENR
jgi:hypothetical protein